MDIRITEAGPCYTVALSGRLDANSAPGLEEALAVTAAARELIFDLAELAYIASAGLRVLLAAQKRMNRQGLMAVRNAGRDILDIFAVTGFDRILNIEKPLREISVDGCELIGEGMCGQCFKLDEETVLKLYHENTLPEWVEREKSYAKAAFVAGVPTAISFDIVSCGRRRGVVFEMLHARTLSRAAADDTDHLPDYAEQLAELAHTVHATPGDPAVFPRQMDYYRGFLDQMTWLSPGQLAALHRCFEELPLAETLVHGDFHPGNVMLSGDKLMFIDMGDFSIGHPLFDIGQIYNIYTREYSTGLERSISKLERVRTGGVSGTLSFTAISGS